MAGGLKLVGSTADVLEMVDAVRVHDATRCTVLDRRLAVDDEDPSTGTMVSLVSGALYELLYCRPSRSPRLIQPDHHAGRAFVDTLSRANTGHGTWDPGWFVTAIESSGGLVVHKPAEDVLLWAAPHQFRPADGPITVGTVGQLALGKELREMLPGFYTILGDADMAESTPGTDTGIVRLYWHLTAPATPDWIRGLSQSLNDAGVPFRAKVLSNPDAYIRADAGVVYVATKHFDAVRATLAPVYGAIAADLRPSTPMLTKQLAPGLAVAEDPGDGSSFGQHRCGLVAEGLLRAHEEGRTARTDVLDSISSRFTEDGLRLGQAWLSRGSRRRYTWPNARPHDLGTAEA